MGQSWIYHLSRCWLLGFVAFGVSACNANPSAFEQVAPVCLLDFPEDPSQPKPEVNAVCAEMLAGLIKFDESFESIDPSGKQKKRVIRALYSLLIYPTEWPKPGQKIFELAPADDFFPRELLEIHGNNPDIPLNQVLFDYVVEAISIYKLSDDKSLKLSAYYQPDRSLLLKTQDLVAPLQDAGLLVHEARHSKYGHDLYCPQYYTSSIECDIGTNKAHGYQFSYLWAVLHGNSRNHLTQEEINLLGRLTLFHILRIATPVKEWKDLQERAASILSNPEIFNFYQTLMEEEYQSENDHSSSQH